VHLVILKEGIQFTKKDRVEPGAYIAETQNGAQFLSVADAGTMNELKEERPFDETKDWNGKKIMLMRVGGFGDLVLMTPVMREMKRRWPDCKIVFCCQQLYGVVLQNLPYIDEIVDYPLAYDKSQEMDAWIFFEKAVEKNPRARELHITDLFAEIAGLTKEHAAGTVPSLFKLGANSGPGWTTDKKPDYAVTKNEVIWAMEQYPRIDGRQRACVQFMTSTANRNYLRMSSVILGLLNKKFEVFLIGGPGESGETKEMEVFKDLTSKGLSFRQTCAVINSSDLVVSPDTAALHIAGALSVPAIGLYGPFPGDLRTRYCPTTFAITAKGACAPCFHHVNPGRSRWTQFPAGKPCEAAGYCVVMGGEQGKNKEGNADGKFTHGIDPEFVVTKALKYAKKFSLTKEE
jgi:ADP-heptose:LPS heptosyltransferase